MQEYRRKDLDLSTRIFLGVEMLYPTELRGWGRASELAEEYGISRSLLYQIRDRVKKALETALKPRAAGRPAEVKSLVIDRDYVQKAIAVMPLLTGSVRSIQMGLALLFGVQRSVGHISQTLQAASEAAERQNKGVRIPLPVLGEADEIFAGRQPCLTVVDGRSFLVLNLAVAERWDATHWGLTFLDLAAQGVVFQDLAADGTRGIRAGLRRQNWLCLCVQTCSTWCGKVNAWQIDWKRQPTKPCVWQKKPGELNKKPCISPSVGGVP
jgi:hypothetical protein